MVRRVGGVADRLDECVGVAADVVHPLRTERVQYGLDRHFTGDLARRRAAHSVSDHEHDAAQPDIDHAFVQLRMSLPGG